MNKYEKAIAELTDEDLKDMLKQTARHKSIAEVRFTACTLTGRGDPTLDGQEYVLLDYLQSFIKREIAIRKKVKK